MFDTLKSYGYTRIIPLFKKYKRYQSYSMSTGMNDFTKIAIICDEMTWCNFKYECPLIFLTPHNWREEFKKHNPTIFFCESTWNGTIPAWRGQIYRDQRVRYENRRELLRILEYCRNTDIPSIFWAKEDPLYYRHAIYDFTDTALLFDHILTTAAECVPCYKAEGHNSVHLWTFGFSEKIFYPPTDESKREHVAIFAGSWYPDHPKRCEDMVKVFNMVLEHGILLRIYDRNSDSSNVSRRFPDKYRAFVREAVPYEALGDIYRGAVYAVNVNTDKRSETMFARRVYEAMACGCIVISNESQAIKEQFGDKIWFSNGTFEHSRMDEVRCENINKVFSKHTHSGRIQDLWNIILKGGFIDGKRLEYTD